MAVDNVQGRNINLAWNTLAHQFLAWEVVARVREHRGCQRLNDWIGPALDLASLTETLHPPRTHNQLEAYLLQAQRLEDTKDSRSRSKRRRRFIEQDAH